jgi:hypothetical protein
LGKNGGIRILIFGTTSSSIENADTTARAPA